MQTALFIAFATVGVTASPVLALIAQDKPQKGEIALVVASPFGSPLEEILNATNMTEAYPNRAPMGTFVHLETQESYNMLIENGAWLVLRGEEILDLC